MTDDQTLRNKPKQARSLKRFNHILDTAAALFEAQGYDAVTTNHIAAEADVSIGSLYRFFPNKEAILEALIDRYREDMQAVFPADVAPPRPIAEVLDEMFANLMRFEATHTGFQTIFLDVEAAAAREQAMRADTVNWVEGLLAAQYPHLSAQRRRIGAEVGVGIVKGLMPLMGTYPPEDIMREIQAAILAYLGDFLQREGG
jgi:AcrR family transcriptional regulator